MVLGYALSPEVERRVFTWLDYKHERGEDYKEASLRALLDQLREAQDTYGYAPLCRLMEQCMASGWKNIVLSRLERETPVRSGGNPFA